jgi:hypothetical protein
MISIKSYVPRLAACALAVAGLVLPTIVSAQDVPSYAQPNRDESIHGRIASVNGTFNISVRDDRGFIDNVELHQGTIINPTGLTLAPGMTVTIEGYGNGGAFAANEIDTPYNYDGPVPVPYYYGPGWWYPGYAYGYGPSFGLTLVFGGGGWYYNHGPFYGRPFAYNGRGFVPGPGGRVTLGGARSVDPAGRASLGAWHSFATARAGYTAPRTTGGYSRGYEAGASRGYAAGASRGYAAGASRGYASGASRGYASASRGSARTSSASRSGGHSRH